MEFILTPLDRQVPPNTDHRPPMQNLGLKVLEI